MKKYIFIIPLIFGIIAISGCIGSTSTGSGHVINQTRNVSGFNQIVMNDTGTLVITQGNNEALTVEAEDNVIPQIKTSVSDNQLNINLDRGIVTPTKPVTYYLTVKDLSSVTINGAGQIQSSNLNTSSLTIRINGAGQGNLTNLTVNTLTITMDGAGRMNAMGKTTNQTINISGAGQYGANNLDSKITIIYINGAGQATVRVSDILNAMINGAGQINYIGNPQITQKINGAGTIKQIQG